MELKNLIASTKTIDIPHPYLDGFTVTLNNLPKEELKKIVKKATTQSFDRKTHQPKEELDETLFIKLYTKATIAGWTGLTAEHLLELMPVDLPEDTKLSEEIEYTEDNALTLIQNSSDFDQWVSSILGDVKNFNKSNL